MKLIKLIFIFVGILAVVAGVVYASGLITPDDNIVVEYTEYGKEVLDKIDREWQKGDDWSKTHFEDTHDYLSVREDKIGNGYATLVEHFQIKALACLHDKTVNTFAKSTCQKIEVDEIKSDLELFKKAAPKQKEEPQLKTLEGIHDVYRHAYSLVYARMGLSPAFDKERGSWNDFNKYEQNIRNQKKGVLKDGYYEYIKNISEIKDSLASLDNRLNKAKDVFMRNLVAEIEAIYNPIVEEINRSCIAINDVTDLESAKSNLSYYEKEGLHLKSLQKPFGSQFDNRKLLTDGIVSSFDNALKRYKNRIEEIELAYREENADESENGGTEL